MPPTLRSIGCALAALLAVAAPSRAARAAVVLKKNSPSPLMGYLVRADERSVVLRLEPAGENGREVTIPRSEIDELIETVSPTRLAELDPAQPAAYFEYAEELAEKRRDPEARDMARRLLVIAADRGDAPLRQSSLLLLADLSRDADERRRVEALLYLHDPRHDVSRLRTPGTADASDLSALGELALALRLLRQGQGPAAKAILGKKEVQDNLAHSGIGVSLAELIAFASERQLSDDQLARVLQAELALLPAPQKTKPSVPWSRSLPSRVPVAPLKLDSLTEFDPAQCLYRSGHWQRP